MSPSVTPPVGRAGNCSACSTKMNLSGFIGAKPQGHQLAGYSPGSAVECPAGLIRTNSATPTVLAALLARWLLAELGVMWLVDLSGTGLIDADSLGADSLGADSLGADLLGADRKRADELAQQ